MADWTEKYRPSTLTEVRGNDSARDELREWAEAWPERDRAVILAGSPGVGKTSAAHALAADMGWEAIEVNASDSRKRDDIERLVGRASRNTTLGGGADRRQLVIVDEADSFHRPDRGGSRALSEIIDDARQPVVLIVNDTYEMPDGLRRRLETIDFRDVSARSIVPVLRDICRREGIEFEDAALEAIAERDSGDLRSAIKDLQAAAEGRDRITEADVVTGERDRTRGIFAFLDDVIKEEDAEGALRSSYDVDETPDDLINWIEDNVPKDYAGNELATAYDFLADADTWLGRVRATQNYSYWRYAADTMTAGVAASRAGDKGGWTRWGPPSFWSKLGRSRSTRDRRDRIARGIAERSGASTASARRYVLPYLRAMTHHCSDRELTIAMAAAYDLDEKDVAFVTGSGADTNKVADIVATAEERREEEAVAHSEGAFEGAIRRDDGLDSGDEPAEDLAVDDVSEADPIDDEDDDGDDGQSGLSDFA